MNDRRIVYLRWIDSTSRTGWTWHEEHKPFTEDDLICETVGWLYDETETLYEIAQSVNPAQYDHVIAIPKVNVRLMYDLQRKAGPRKQKAA
jgi:hypothetical protein